MIKRHVALLFFLINLSLIGFPQTYSGSVIRVIEGDTFVFQTKEGSLTVRMFGTDAPERSTKDTKTTC